MSAPSIPDHTLLRSIGRGSYGEVWLARNIMGTPRAVKIIWRRRFESDRPYDREFAGIQGYEPVSRTSDGLMQVLHVGRNEGEGYFYYVMELADDARRGSRASTGSAPGTNGNSPNSESPVGDYSPRTLRSDLNGFGRLPMADCLRVALDLVTGLACLHRHGLVHRDVKPGNIIFVNGRAKLADIGLVSTRNEGQTFVGTEGYIPPEGPGSPAADLYALGMVLYEAATGQPPEKFPQTPLEWFAEGTGGERLEFHEIVLKAGEGSRERRYQTAGELQADLALLQSGQSLRRVRALQRRANLSRRLALAAGVAVVVAVGSVLLGNYRVRVEAEQRAREQIWRQEAEQARTNAERAERQAREQLFAALLEQARANVRSGELGQRFQTLDAIRRAAGISNTVELRREAIAALARPDLKFEGEFPLGLDTTMVVLDPKFERLALGRGTNAIEIRSVPEQRLLSTLPASGNQPANSGRWSQDGHYLGIRRNSAVRDALAEVEIRDVADERRLLPAPRSRYGAFAFHPNEPRVLFDTGSNAVSLWHLPERRAPRDLEPGPSPAKESDGERRFAGNATWVATFAVTGAIHQLEFSPDGKSFLVQHRIERIWFTSLYDAASGAARRTTVSGWIDGVAWEARDRWVALAARNGEVHLHERQTGTTSLLGRHKSEARSAVFSPDGEFLFTGGAEQEIICWDLRARQRAFNIGLGGAQMQFRNDGRCAVMTGTGVMLHSFVHARPCRDLIGDLGGGIRHGAFSPDGRWLAAGGLTRLGLWDLKGEAPAAVAVEAENAKPFFMPDGSELFAFWVQGHGRWHIDAGHDGRSPPKSTALPPLQAKRIYSGQFTSNSLVLGTGSGALIVPRTNLTAAGVQPAYVGYVTGEVSPDAQWFAGLKGNTLLTFRLNPWTRAHSDIFDADLLAHAFTPRGDELAVASRTGVTFLDTNRWKRQRHLPAPVQRYPQLIFTPNGRAFWLARDARVATLYDTQTFEPLVRLPVGLTPLALSPDGRYLAASVDARQLQLWDLVDLRTRLEELGLGWKQ